MIAWAKEWIQRFRERHDRVAQARRLGVRVGRDCLIYGCDFGSEPWLIAIGDHVLIASGVQFITHDGGTWVFRHECADWDVFGPIRVGNNVFIGLRAILLPGAEIGDSCVIGAGAVVVGKIPPNSVVAGVPARVIRPLSEYHDDLKARALHTFGLPPGEKRRAIEAAHPEWFR